ncbi:uncharacterized protein LOC106866657 [Brachypodium distachyon]|uniref:uncharacterized protein LOC106866657 n=1 Tax=Brachypodium distachyon TaxID=15368 RepID=UPI00071C6954|nr:uncharacterized protein LOC106866657 [Brachypodium distachyon]|eukprot:XP_014757740.1 uncharacterized protein LOC106866657 [Brachypodium distachyon]
MADIDSEFFFRHFMDSDGEDSDGDTELLMSAALWPQGEKRCRFSKEHESARKNVKRAFRVLQARWAIVRHPARTWDVEIMAEVMTACVIMHNMIVEDERDDSIFDKEWDFRGDLVEP